MANFLRSLLVLLLLLIALPTSAATPTQDYKLSLPMISNGGARGLLGIETTALDAAHDFGGLAALGPGWVRRNGLQWRDVEPSLGGGYHWESSDSQALEAELRAAATRGLRVILVVQGSPAWAVTPYGADCAPINPEHHAAFARFLEAAVARYSAPPFNVRYWEIANEPDAFVFPSDAPFGCWGRTDAELYGGEAYGEVLKAVYPAIKRADPQAQVVHGGLLLSEPYDPSTGTGRSGRFLEGVLAAGAGDSFDILAFHSYSFYNGTPDGSTGAQDWKPAYLRAILARRGLTKPLLNSEGALLCVETSADCANAQAYAMARNYVRALRDDLIGFIWYIYNSDGFYHTALIDPQQPAVRRPAYAAFAQAAAALDGYQYREPLAGLPPGVEGHMLAKGQSIMIVIWANTPTTTTVALPAAGTVSCKLWDGSVLPCSASNGSLIFSARPEPLYIQVTQP